MIFVTISGLTEHLSAEEKRKSELLERLDEADKEAAVACGHSLRKANDERCRLAWNIITINDSKTAEHLIKEAVADCSTPYGEVECSFLENVIGLRGEVVVGLESDGKVHLDENWKELALMEIEPVIKKFCPEARIFLQKLKRRPSGFHGAKRKRKEVYDEVS